MARAFRRVVRQVKSGELHACHRVGQCQGEAENKPDQRNAQHLAVVSVIGHPGSFSSSSIFSAAHRRRCAEMIAIKGAE
jgi:hypothetical protein